MNSKIKVSAVSYTNTLPFIRGIKKAQLEDLMELSVDYPSQCAAKVISGEADLGIIPVAGLLDIKTPHLITDYCIGSDGTVNSVFLFSKVPVSEIKTLRLDYQSRTSNGLARILLAYYWKQEVELVSDDREVDAYVLIGDRTFGKKNSENYVYDLGYYWKELTGLPFAYAVWVSIKELDPEFVDRFNKALKQGVAECDEVIDSLEKREDFDFYDYFYKYLDFDLNDGKRKAIEKYLELLKTLP
ncbi:MAG TPA: menaquinone biosynthesis protein [Candidatus Sphingobacterium stercoripullorum]|uniref:Chorismate dehydratase n=1 Tax=Candidatus Sphingobacterium stercoripullorum TaxID=2838759 RepID=A0A9D2AXR4_9SPHI|nr:menaquinone biosynthesis protein [Candidatus Sphingobacterium stercoripullorum]HLR50366.1 menaquinone biosynthesis protein [Candidatus Sphingobacterium stercoripullorum]